MAEQNAIFKLDYKFGLESEKTPNSNAESKIYLRSVEMILTSNFYE